MLIWAFLFFIHTKIGRYYWDKTKLVVPIVKKLCRALYISRSLHTMGVLTSAGVPILDTLSITSEISGNVLYKKMWVDVHDSVRQGQKIASSLATSSLLPSSVVQMIRSGEDSGKLADVLRDVSEFYARELKATIKTVTAMIEPIMIIVDGFCRRLYRDEYYSADIQDVEPCAGKTLMRLNIEKQSPPKGGMARSEAWPCLNRGGRHGRGFTLIEVMISHGAAWLCHHRTDSGESIVHQRQRSRAGTVHGGISYRTDQRTDG